MLLRKKSADTYAARKPISRQRIAVWCIALVACVLFSALVMTSPEKITREYNRFECQDHDFRPYEIAPGGTLEQHFTALGQSVGEVSHLFLNVFRESSSQGSLTIRLYREKTGEVLAEAAKEHADLPGCDNVKAAVQEAHTLSMADSAQRPAQEEIHTVLTTPVMLGDGGWYLLKSGEEYRLEIINHSESDSVYLLGNAEVQSGKLLIDGEQQPGFLNLSWMRKSLYTPSRLLLLMVLLTDATVLFGLALVLFTDVKTHVLYLVLAVGFGVVTLFDLTPLYGFDMKFQFDSTYVVSNQIMGLEGSVWESDPEDPEQGSLFYYRRACDDYSQYQFYQGNEVSANYTDMKAGLRKMFASEEEQELILAQTDLGFISTQLYMYIPQAIGFTIARLLELGMYPMLQLARLIVYAVFVTTMYFSIRRVPFGKQIFLVLALIPTVMVQMISLTRDAMIICMSFYIIAKAIQLAYASEKPKLWDWLQVLVVSILLAPCKMIYLPVSCLFLLILYRHYILPAGDKGKKIVLRLLLIGGAVMIVFVLTNLPMIESILFADTVSVYDSEAYSIPYMLANPLHTLYVFGNTIRTQLGAYLVNAVQLFDINLGCSDGITIIIFVLLALGCCCADSEQYDLRKKERGFMLLIAIGVFLLTALASMRWTPITSNVIVGLQGRYLTPVLPLVCLACCSNRTVRVNENAALIVKAGCCIFPAISLMNMYLWTITC